MSRQNKCPIPPISLAESDPKRTNVIPLIKYYNPSANPSSFQNQPPIVSPSPQRLSTSGRPQRGLSPARSMRSQPINPFQHFDTDFLFDIVKYEKIDDDILNNLIIKLEQRLLKLIPDAKSRIQKEIEDSAKKSKEFSLQIEETLLFESSDYNFDEKEDGREKEIQILEEKIQKIAQSILSRNNQQ